MDITLPDLSLVLLIGPSGSGKSTFARKHFLGSEVVSSDFCRYLVSDDENNQAVTCEAFELLRFIVGKRLAGGKLTIVDATSVQPEARKPLLELAREYRASPVAIVFDLPERVCASRNLTRTDRTLDARVISYQMDELKRSLCELEGEGFCQVHILGSEDAVEGRSDPAGTFNVTIAGQKTPAMIVPAEQAASGPAGRVEPTCRIESFC